MKRHLVAATVLLAASPVFAQGHGPISHGFGPGGSGSMRQSVTNAPYSGTFTNTSTEKLQDGTTLTHTSTRVVSRDSLGRTREEITLPARGSDGRLHTRIVIVDPVAKTITNLNTEKKTAFVHAMREPHGNHGFGDENGRGGDRGPGRHGPGASSPAGDTAEAAPTQGGEGHRGPREHKDIAITDLGSKSISGVLATGRRVTRTIPANTMGNSAPILSSHEDWFSPDLRVELSHADVDPFRGTDTLTTSTLTKGEPDPALFKVPGGYTVEVVPQRAFGRRGFGGPHRGGDNTPPVAM